MYEWFRPNDEDSNALADVTQHATAHFNIRRYRIVLAVLRLSSKARCVHFR